MYNPVLPQQIIKCISHVLSSIITPKELNIKPKLSENILINLENASMAWLFSGLIVSDVHLDFLSMKKTQYLIDQEYIRCCLLDPISVNYVIGPKYPARATYEEARLRLARGDRFREPEIMEKQREIREELTIRKGRWEQGETQRKP